MGQDKLPRGDIYLTVAKPDSPLLGGVPEGRGGSDTERVHAGLTEPAGDDGRQHEICTKQVFAHETKRLPGATPVSSASREPVFRYLAVLLTGPQDSTGELGFVDGIRKVLGLETEGLKGFILHPTLPDHRFHVVAGI